MSRAFAHENLARSKLPETLCRSGYHHRAGSNFFTGNKVDKIRLKKYRLAPGFSSKRLEPLHQKRPRTTPNMNPLRALPPASVVASCFLEVLAVWSAIRKLEVVRGPFPVSSLMFTKPSQVDARNRTRAVEFDLSSRWGPSSDLNWVSCAESHRSSANTPCHPHRERRCDRLPARPTTLWALVPRHIERDPGE